MSEALNIVMSVMLIALFFMWVGDATNIHTQYRTEAIERGYAQYCPQNGSFAWVGECDLVESN